jgi:SNF2 family DNA or RNA helicase
MGEVTYTEYPFKTKPYKHQLDAWRLSRDRLAFALFMDQGTGKSKVVIDTAGHLYLNRKIRGSVVVAPKGMYLCWPEEQIPAHTSEAVPTKVAYWSSYANKEEQKSLKNLHEEGDFLRTLVVNVEAMNSERAVDEVVAFMKRYPCMLTVDESTTIKNPSAKRTKILTNVGKYAEYRRVCSGNPMPNGPLDLYSQAEFLRHNILGYGNYFSFRNRFAVMQDQKFGNRSFKHVVGYRDLDTLKRLMGQFSFIVKKEDCLDLPPKIYQSIDVEMGPRQAEAYCRMREDAFIQLSESQNVTANMVMTQLLRLHQISCGFIKPDHMDEVPFGEPNDRMEQLMELLTQCRGKAIIWATYRYNIRQIVAAISEKFGADSVSHYYGETTKDERREATRNIQDPSSPVRWIVANPDTGKFGNTWIEPELVVYYSNSYNLEHRSQSEDRSHRIGQTKSVVYVDLRCRGTVDDKIIRVLKAKKKLSDDVVASNWQWLLGVSAQGTQN